MVAKACEFEELLKDFQPLEDLPKSSKDANAMFTFATDILNVPLDNIVIMSSEEDYDSIIKRYLWSEATSRFQKWMDRPCGDLA